MRKNLCLMVLCMASLLPAIQTQALEKAAFFMKFGNLPKGYDYCRPEAVSADGSVVVGTMDGLEGFRWSIATGMEGLGSLPFGSPHSAATGVSADGSVVVGNTITGSDPEVFRWTYATGMVGLGAGSSGEIVSADGSVVVGTIGSKAFRWTKATGMVGLGGLTGGQSANTAYGVSADGSVVVGSSPSSLGYEAYRWEKSTGMKGLGDLPGGQFLSNAWNVSADGSVVVGFGTTASGLWEAYRWEKATGMKGLGDFPGGVHFSSASGVSADGSVVVGFGTSASGKEPFRWEKGTGMKGIGSLCEDCQSKPFHMSANGSVIIGKSGNENFSQAFIWDSKNGMQALKDVLTDTYGLDLFGWSLQKATEISADGKTIVGFGEYQGGGEKAWIAYLGPNCGLAPRFAQTLTTLSQGMTLYKDRLHTLTGVPAQYVGLPVITTFDDERNLTVASGYVTFPMPYHGMVFVGYDSRAKSKPDWLNGFNYTGDKLETSLNSQPALKIYSRYSEQWDCVNLGGNKATGFSGGEIDNYIVFYDVISKPNELSPPTGAKIID